MAFYRKKTDFKPDSPTQDLIRRLYLSPQQQRRYLKWILYGALALVLLVLQDVLFSRMRLYGATIDPVPCVLMMICVIQGAGGGCVFTLLGALVYYLSGSAPGVYVILLIPLFGVLAAAFRQAYLRVGFRATVVCTAVAVVLYELLSFAAGLLLGLTRLGRIHVAVLTTGLSLLILPILFLFVRGIAKIGGDAWKE